MNNMELILPMMAAININLGDDYEAVKDKFSNFEQESRIPCLQDSDAPLRNTSSSCF